MALPVSLAIHTDWAWMLTQIPNEPLPAQSRMDGDDSGRKEEPPPPPPPEPEKEEPLLNPNRSQNPNRNQSQKKSILRISHLSQLKNHLLNCLHQQKKVQRVQGLSASLCKQWKYGTDGTCWYDPQYCGNLKTIDIEDTKESTAISYAVAINKQPRLKKRPPLKIPQTVIDAGIEGTVQIVIDIDEIGLVNDARIKEKSDCRCRCSLY